MFLAILLLLPAGLLVFLPIGVEVGIIGSIALLAIGLGFLWATTPTVEVTDAALRAGRATLPMQFVGTAVAITGEDATVARGRELDARAWLLLRGWVKDVVRVENTDPNDPAPYWLISTRRPAELVDALTQARAATATS